MRKFTIKGGRKLAGEVTISGSKNVVSKVIVAASLTSEPVEIHNIPLISDFYVAIELAEELGATVELKDRTLKIQFKTIKSTQIPLDAGAKSRTASLFLGPLLARAHEATVPNPGGCRLGARPIDRHIEGLEQMGAQIKYYSGDGYFHAKAEVLKGVTYRFEKNTHTGTETLILAAVLAHGTTILENAAEEPEIDDLISLLNQMGAHIERTGGRTIRIQGVKQLHGTTYTIMNDRNEAVTFAVLSALNEGNIYLKSAPLETMGAFLEKFKQAGGTWEKSKKGVRFYAPEGLKAVDIMTLPHPGFMTDWQGSWSVLMTQAHGESTIHETIYENRFSYVKELSKMGAHVKLTQPKIEHPESVYNFNYDKHEEKSYKQMLTISGPTQLHNAVLNIEDLRAGATLVVASLIAKGESIIYGIEHIERGYEAFAKRLEHLGAHIVGEEA